MEYESDFQDRIVASDFEKKAKEIADWIEGNRNLHDWAKDPNAYEMVNVFLFAGKYLSEGYDLDTTDVKRIWDLRSEDFKNCNISENHFVYQICKQAYDYAMEKRALVNQPDSHRALRKMAGIGLFLKQQKRDNIVEYNNYNELELLIKDSKMLRQNYPELHKNFRFDENIEVLYQLQKLQLKEDDITTKRLDILYQDYKGKSGKSNIRKENENIR